MSDNESLVPISRIHVFLEAVLLSWSSCVWCAAHDRTTVKWVGIFVQNVLFLFPSPLAQSQKWTKILFFLSSPILWEERQPCNTSYYKFNFLKQAAGGGLWITKREEKGNLWEKKFVSVFLGLKDNSECHKSISTISVRRRTAGKNMYCVCVVLLPKMHTVKPRVENERFLNFTQTTRNICPMHSRTECWCRVSVTECFTPCFVTSDLWVYLGVPLPPLPSPQATFKTCV